ncbi:MAG: TatD family hydrolase [Candidatus Aenigmatarchaeota archaeon]
MIDVHCHLEHDSLKNDIENVIKKCKEEVKALVTSSPHPKDFEYSIFLAEKFFGYVYVCLGLHPEYIEDIDEKVIEDFKSFVEKNKDRICGIGEIGLDYFWIKDEKLRNRQKELFIECIEFSKKLNKPIVVHIREAYEDALKILEESGYQKVLLHMFGGDKFLDKILSNEWKISVGPIVSRSKVHKKIVKRIPLERIMLETDSPWMKIDGRPSFPTDVKFVAAKIAEIKKIDINEIENVTDNNAKEFFGLKIIQ